MLHGQGSRTPITRVTTEAEKSRVIEAVRDGTNHSLTRPFTVPQLADRIKAILPITSQRPHSRGRRPRDRGPQARCILTSNWRGFLADALRRLRDER